MKLFTRTESKKSLFFKSDLTLYSMLVPGFLFFLLFSYVPIGFMFVSLQDYKAGAGIWGSEFIGLKNFSFLLNDSFFYVVLRNTLLINIYKIIFCFPFPIILALAFNEMHDGVFKKFMQSAVYLPHFISWVVVLGLMIGLFSVNNGLINKVITSLGYEPIVFMGSKQLYRGFLVVTEIWKGAGWGSIIYLASLTGINPSLYDAANVDGASKLRQVWHISIPGIRNTIVVIFILQLGGLLSNSFEQVFVTLNPMVYEVGEIIPTYVFHKGIEEFKISYSAAVGFFQSLIGFVLVLSTNMLARKFGGSSLW
jgi:putative aldouronate transport system permease protein